MKSGGVIFRGGLDYNALEENDDQGNQDIKFKESMVNEGDNSPLKRPGNFPTESPEQSPDRNLEGKKQPLQAGK